MIKQHELLPWHNYRKSKQPDFPYTHTAGGKTLGFNREFPRISFLHNSLCLGRYSKPRGRKLKDMWRKFSNITFIEQNSICFLHCERIAWRWEPSSAANYKSKQPFHFNLTKKRKGRGQGYKVVFLPSGNTKRNAIVDKMCKEYKSHELQVTGHTISILEKCDSLTGLNCSI